AFLFQRVSSGLAPDPLVPGALLESRSFRGVLGQSDRSKDYWSRSNVAGVCSLLQFRHSTVNIGIGPCQFALFHYPNLVVRCSGYLVFDGLAPSAMANGKAVNAVFNKLSIFTNVIS